MVPTTLARGEFFGSARSKTRTGDFALSWMRPTILPHEMALHTHADVHFMLVLAGSYQSLAYRKGEVTHGPALVFNPAGTEHRDCFTDLRATFMTVTLDALRYAELADGASAQDPLHLSQPDAIAIALALFRAAYGGGDALHAEALALELVAATCRGAAVPLSRSAPGWLSVVTEMIQDRSGDQLGLREIAQAVNVHPVYLTRVFRTWMQQTPGEFHRRCRMERAFADLLRGGQSAAQVALAAGFADQAHFTRAFSGLYGIAPTRFARLLQECDQVCSVQDSVAAAGA